MADQVEIKRSKSLMFNMVETIFSITAFILMWLGTMRCNFIKFVDTSGTSEPIALEFGIWSYQFWSLVTSTSGTFIFESCHGYPDYIQIDDTWKAARAFSVLAFVFALVVFITSTISACTSGPYQPLTRGWMAPAYLLTAIFQGLMLLLLNSNACKNNALVKYLDLDPNALRDITFPDTCSISTGAKLCISATTFWTASALASFVAHKAELKELQQGEKRYAGTVLTALEDPLIDT